MNNLKPKAQHEKLLADADKEKIAQYLENDQDQEITKIAVALARQCGLLIHFTRLWEMRVSGLDERLGTEEYINRIYTNKRELHKKFLKEDA